MKYKNKEVVENLVREHSATLVRFLSRRMKSREDAEDIAQAAFMKLYSLDKTESLANAKAFLFQIAANMSIDQLRRENLHRNYMEGEMAKDGDDSDGEFSGRSEPPLDRELEAKEILQLLYGSLARLPLNVRQAFIMSRSKGMSYGEIASQLGVSVSSVEKYILEALKQLRKVMERGERLPPER